MKKQVFYSLISLIDSKFLSNLYKFLFIDIIMKKRGGLQLSISTIVIVILAVTMLVLGLVFVKKSMCSAIDGVNQINDLVRDQIADLYTDQNQKVAVKESSNDIRRGITYGVAFSVKNLNEENDRFDYDVKVIDTGSCDIRESVAESYMVLGKSGRLNIQRGQDTANIIRFDIPSDAPLCKLRYQVDVKNDGEIYDTTFFDVNIINAGFMQKSLC